MIGSRVPPSDKCVRTGRSSSCILEGTLPYHAASTCTPIPSAGSRNGAREVQNSRAIRVRSGFFGNTVNHTASSTNNGSYSLLASSVLENRSSRYCFIDIFDQIVDTNSQSNLVMFWFEAAIGENVVVMPPTGK